MASSISLRTWRMVVMGAILIGAFVVADSRLFHGQPTTSGNGLPLATSTGVVSGKADVAPSNALVQRVTEAVGNLSGLDDMAVLPDGIGDGGYLVSAIIELSDVANGNLSSANLTTVMKAMVDQYFKDVYAVSSNITQAELTFTIDGQLVGSAGLGKDAFQSMATSTMHEDIASALLNGPTRDNGNANEMWMQIKP